MALATLSIDLVARLAQLQAGLDKAGQLSAKAAEQIQRNFAAVKGVAVGVGTAFAAMIPTALISHLVDIGRATNDGVDKLNDLKAATGSTVENLSALEDIGARTGTSIDTIGDAVLKLNKQLSAATPGSQAESVLTAIGLSAATLRKLDPAEALRQVSVALAGYADGGDKARIVQQLFGKSTAEVGKFLEDLAEAGRLNATVTSAQAKAANDLNNQLAALSKNSTDAARALVSGIVPVLTELLGLYVQFKNGPGFTAGVGEFFKGNTAFITDAASGLKLYDEKLQGAIADREAFIKAWQNNPPANGLAAYDKEIARLQQLASVYRNVVNAFSAGAGRGNVNPGQSADKPHVGHVATPEEIADAKKAAEQFEKLAASIGLVSAAASLEISGADKLSEIQTARLKLLEDLNNGEAKFNASERASLQAIADSLPLLDKELRLRRLQQEVGAAYSLRQSEQQRAELEREFGARVDATNALRDQLEEYGKTAEQIEALRIARLEDQAAQEDLLILTLRNVEGTESEVAARELNVKALRAQVTFRKQLAEIDRNTRTNPTAGAQRALDEYLQKVNDAGTATHDAVAQGLSNLEDALTSFATKGKLSFRAFVDDALAQMIRLQIVRPLLAGLFGGAGAFGAGGIDGLQAFFSNTKLGGSGFGTGAAYGNHDFGEFFAGGGYLGAGKWGVAGEYGPEIIKGPAQIVPPAKSGGHTFVVNIQGDASEQTIALIQAAQAQFAARMSAPR